MSVYRLIGFILGKLVNKEGKDFCFNGNYFWVWGGGYSVNNR